MSPRGSARPRYCSGGAYPSVPIIVPRLSDWNTLAIARWNKVDAAGNRTRMASFFRVQNGLVTEWMNTQLEGAAPAAAANPNAPACQTVNTTLAAFAPAPR